MKVNFVGVTMVYNLSNDWKSHFFIIFSDLPGKDGLEEKYKVPKGQIQLKKRFNSTLGKKTTLPWGPLKKEKL